MARSAKEAQAPFQAFMIQRGNHFDILSPLTGLIAEKILAKWRLRDPCGTYYFARSLAAIEHPQAVATLRRAVEGGYICHPLLARDPWRGAHVPRLSHRRARHLGHDRAHPHPVSRAHHRESLKRSRHSGVPRCGSGAAGKPSTPYRDTTVFYLLDSTILLA